MRNLLVVFVILISLCQSVLAASINPAAYRTMQMQTYRHNQMRNINNNLPVPYWRLQSNYSTRNRGYQSYYQYENSVNRNSTFSGNTRGY